MPQYPTCSHIKEDGSFCGVAALSGRRYCYYHLNLRGRRLRRAQARRRAQPFRLQLPALENLHAIQVAIGEILDAMAEGQLEAKAGAVMLYGIQQATTVMLKIQDAAEWADDDDDYDEDQPKRVREFPAFEQQYGLPPDVNLEADPDLALQFAEVNSVADAQQGPIAATTPPAADTHPPKKREPNSELTFHDLKRKLEYVQETMRRGADASKPPASLTAEDEDCEEADSA